MANAIKLLFVFVVLMANVIKPLLFCFCKGKRYKIHVCLSYCDGKRYNTNVFSLIAMSNNVKPLFFFVYCDGKLCNTTFLLLLQWQTL